MNTEHSDRSINTALRSFEAAEANLAKLERLFRKIRSRTPKGLSFGTTPEYEALCRSYEDILAVLPKIDGWKPSKVPMDLNSIGQARLDAREIDEIAAVIAVEEEIDSPGRELAEYRHRLNNRRRQLVREALPDIVAEVDKLLPALKQQLSGATRDDIRLDSSEWEELKVRVKEIETLLGAIRAQPKSWGLLLRHLHFGQAMDLGSILNYDWPSVRNELVGGVYHEDEPIPVDVDDLGALVAEHPQGRIVTALRWDRLDAEDFERLIFSLINGADGYDNPQWLMRTNAPDRGRDLSVVRIAPDSLGETRHSRVIIQCKHWLTKSMSPADIAELKEQMGLWEPPRVDALVIATSSRFSSDAVAAVEKHNQSDRALRIEMWPESHLERLLARRPSLIAEFRLR